MRMMLNELSYFSLLVSFRACLQLTSLASPALSLISEMMTGGQRRQMLTGHHMPLPSPAHIHTPEESTNVLFTGIRSPVIGNLFDRQLGNDGISLLPQRLNTCAFDSSLSATHPHPSSLCPGLQPPCLGKPRCRAGFKRG